MNLKFDYYQNLETPELYLCNPDNKELFPLVGYNRNVVLRFNDLSELTFECYSTTTLSSGEVVTLDSYNYVQTRRKVFVTGIGYFVITNVEENDDGVTKHKAVTCSSEQIIFQDRGVYLEDRVYYLYNPSDPYDEHYDDSDESSVPSVLGQMYQQLGIQQALLQGRTDPVSPYDRWTVTYVSSALQSLARTFAEGTKTGYEWMASDVPTAFEAVVLFDYYYRTIHLLTPGEVTEKANVLFTFSNFMKDVQVTENADEIVTVLNCNGENCDITQVNPTGTNYICDFSYYMDDQGRWMSSDLKSKLQDWETLVETQRPFYEATISSLKDVYEALATKQSELTEISTIYSDLEAAVAKRTVAMGEGTTAPYGVVWAETVPVSQRSIDPNSKYYSSAFTSSSQITAYLNQPTYSSAMNVWLFTGSFITGTAEYCYSYVDSMNRQYLYFADNQSTSSYCMLDGKATINPLTYDAEYTVSGFKRYIELGTANKWTKLYDKRIKTLNSSIDADKADIATYQATLSSISSQCNILNYFASTPTLLRELECYWIEGDYTNDNITVLENATRAEEIELGEELLEAGQIELSKVCQPKLQFSLTSVDCTKLYEFRNQMSELELGKIITIEKEEGLWYYPALLEMEYNLDTSETFTLTFANALRLDDWGYTYGDLLQESSAAVKQVSANWQNILAYSKERETLGELVRYPLSSTLRAAFSNMTNQEFIVDDTGILGRKFSNANQDEFDNEQLRIINNMIVFTDDNWATARAALGKITYNGQTSYGLIADTIIGSLILGENLQIQNSGGSVLINSMGITIKNPSNEIVFTATPTGIVSVKGAIYADYGYIGGQNGFTINSNRIYSNSRSSFGNTSRSGVYIGSDGISILSDDKSSYLRLNVGTSTFEFGGIIYATGGKFVGDGIEVRTNSGKQSVIDLLDVGRLTVSDSILCPNIETSELRISGTETSSTPNIGHLRFTKTILFDESLSSSSQVSIAFIGTYTCTVTPEAITHTVTVTPNGGTVPSLTQITATVNATIDFGEDYGTATFTKNIDVYIPANSSSSVTASIDDNNRFHANGTVTSRSVSLNPNSRTYTVPSSSGTCLTITNTVVPGAMPGGIAMYDLGTSARRWRTAYFTQGPYTSSDASLKKDIGYDMSAFDLVFDDLKPALYRLKDCDTHQHLGFVAQDVEASLKAHNIDATKSGLLVSDDVMMLNYTEFIALNTFEIQQLKRRIKALEQLLEQRG